MFCFLLLTPRTRRQQWYLNPSYTQQFTTWWALVCCRRQVWCVMLGVKSDPTWYASCGLLCWRSQRRMCPIVPCLPVCCWLYSSRRTGCHLQTFPAAVACCPLLCCVAVRAGRFSCTYRPVVPPSARHAAAAVQAVPLCGHAHLCGASTGGSGSLHGVSTGAVKPRATWSVVWCMLSCLALCCSHCMSVVCGWFSKLGCQPLPVPTLAATGLHSTGGLLLCCAQECHLLCCCPRLVCCQGAGRQIAKASSPLDGQLFVIQHLLFLREQIAHFDVDLTVTDIDLDFSHMRDHVRRIMTGE